MAEKKNKKVSVGCPKDRFRGQLISSVSETCEGFYPAQAICGLCQVPIEPGKSRAVAVVGPTGMVERTTYISQVPTAN